MPSKLYRKELGSWVDMNDSYASSVNGMVGDINLGADDVNAYTQAQTNTQISNAIDGLVDAAPGTLDTLNELSAALGDDPNFATTMTNTLANKADAGHTHPGGISESDPVNFTSTVSFAQTATFHGLIRMTGNFPMLLLKGLSTYIQVTNNILTINNEESAFSPAEIRLSGHDGTSSRIMMRCHADGGVILHHVGVSKAYTVIDGFNVTGTLTATGNVVSFSDRRLKSDLLEITGALDMLDEVTPSTYTRNDMEGNTRFAGVMAQDLQKVLPEAVSICEGDTFGVSYGAVATLAIAACKELKTQNDQLEDRIQRLEALILE